MSRRFSMTSNPVRASESQDEAEPLLGDAERVCDDVVEAIGFGNWSLLLVILLGFLFMGDSIEATLLSFLRPPRSALLRHHPARHEDLQRYR